MSFGYPAVLWIFTQRHVSVAAGGSATVPVTVSVPAGARKGTYVAGLLASTGTGTGGAQLGAAAESLLMFTVGITRPPAAVLDHSGTCWAPPGSYQSWAQWSGTGWATAPPGWYWQGPAPGQAGSWVYTPPPGWYWDWPGAAGRQVYRGGEPVQACADAARYPDAETGGDFIGGQYPDTSTAAGCAAWLAASAAGKLTAEPVLPSSGTSPAPTPQRVQLDAASKRMTAKQHAEVAAGLAAAVVVFIVIPLAWRSRRRERRRRRGY